MLLDHISARLIDEGTKSMQLGVSVANEQAIRAYEKYGFNTKRHQMELELDAQKLVAMGAEPLSRLCSLRRIYWLSAAELRPLCGIS